MSGPAPVRVATEAAPDEVAAEPARKLALEERIALLDPATRAAFEKRLAEHKAALAAKDRDLEGAQNRYDAARRSHDEAMGALRAELRSDRVATNFLWLFAFSGWVGGFALSAYAIAKFCWHQITSGEAVPLVFVGVLVMAVCYITAAIKGGRS